MPWWAVVYWSLVVLLCAAGIVDDRKHGWAYVVPTLASGIVMCWLALAYWLPELRHEPRALVIALFLASLAWWLYTAHVDLEQVKSLVEDPVVDQRWVAIGVYVSLVFLAPALYWAAFAAFAPVAAR